MPTPPTDGASRRENKYTEDCEACTFKLQASRMGPCEQMSEVDKVYLYRTPKGTIVWRLQIS